MKDTLLIFRKEFYQTFKDKRTVFSSFVLPVILFLVIFQVIGSMQTQTEQRLQETTFVIFTNQETLAREVLHQAGILFQIVTDTPDDLDQSIRDREIHLAMIFSDPAKTIDEYIRMDNLQIEFISFSEQMESSRALNHAFYGISQLRNQEIRSIMQSLGVNPEVLNRPYTHTTNIATEREQAGNFLGMMLPYMLVIYLFAGSFSLGFDTTAGEKERQTLTILLVNQVSRTAIAWGKILYMMLANLLMALISSIAFSIGFSRMMSGGSDMGGNFMAAFSADLVAMLIITVLSMSVIVATIIAAIGIFAKTVKEATAYTMPLYIVAVIFGIMSMQPGGLESIPFIGFIPLMNGIDTLKALFTSNVIPYQQILQTVLINVGVAVFLAWVTSRMFSNEKFVFRTEN